MMKKQVRQIVDRLPADATWNDVMDEPYIKAKEGAATKPCRAAPGSEGGAQGPSDERKASSDTSEALEATTR